MKRQRALGLTWLSVHHRRSELNETCRHITLRFGAGDGTGNEPTSQAAANSTILDC
jgi:hypothetical protein